MNTVQLAEIRADFRADLRANRLPNTVELAAWRNRVAVACGPTPVGTSVTRAHAGSTVTNDARLGGVGHEATVSGFTSLNSGGAGYSRPPAFSGKSQHG